MKLPDTTPTAEEVAAFAEKFQYSADEVAVLTPEERAAMLDEPEPQSADPSPKAPAPGDEAITEDADELEARGYADTATDPGMPHARVRAEPKAPAQADPAAGTAATAKPAAAAVEPAATTAAASATATKIAEPSAAEPVAVAEVADDAEQPFVVRLPVPAAREYAAELEAVAKKFEDGDITTAEHTKQVAEISRAQAHADFVTQFNEQAETQGWERQQTVFLNRHKEYDFKTNPVRFAALDGALKAIGRAEPTLDNWAALQKAHQMVEKELGAAKVAPPPAPAVDPVPAPAPKPAARAKPDLSLVPQTLAHVPSAAEHEDGNDRFAVIDKLEGLAQETAIAQLSERDLDEYLRRATA